MDDTHVTEMLEVPNGKLAKSLRALCRGKGVFDSDLLNRLQNDLQEVRRYCKVPMGHGIENAQQYLAAALERQIKLIRPGTELRPKAHRIGPDEIYRNTIRICFNILQNPTLQSMGLVERQNEAASAYEIDLRTVRRYLAQAVDQIANAFISNSGISLLPPDPSTAKNTSPPPIEHARSAAQIAHLMTLTMAAHEALEARRDLCRDQKRAFYTFDLLIALLDVPDSRVLKCFIEYDRDWAAKVRIELAAMADPARSEHKYAPFAWKERDDVLYAYRIAFQDQLGAANEIHVLLGVLETPSNTSQWLKASLGENLAKLRAIAERMRRDRGGGNIPSPTPDLRR